ncbi:MAG: peptide chain release factor 2 [Desulfovibrionaceae bacterium]|nr:peptide chain release factor 2 [Desulfovibrionaceae bacterium]
MRQFSELKSQAQELAEKSQTLWRRLDLEKKTRRLDDINQQISVPEAWNEPDKLTPILREKSLLENELARLKEMDAARREAEEWLLLAGEEESAEALEALEASLGHFGELLEKNELRVLLGREGDGQGAILEIHPGAGGTEAQDWAEMLERMYMRWAESRNFAVECLDYLAGDEAGIKSVTLRVRGENAYGFLKNEKGIHRLIRISPFDSSGRRHTSFASVDVLPDVGDNIRIEINDKDLRVDVFRAGGAGGQHVNRTNSAVRITHLPTGVVAQCQDEKSQHQNRDLAMSILKAKLYALELKKREEAQQASYQNKEAINFGSQIRTYTMQPYQLVKDHRSGSEITDVGAVLDGKLDKLIRDNLLYAQ